MAAIFGTSFCSTYIQMKMSKDVIGIAASKYARKANRLLSSEIPAMTTAVVNVLNIK